MILPRVPSEPKRRLEDYSFLFHGPPKVGKTSLMKDLGYLFLDYERGTKALREYSIYIPDWETTDEVITELEDSNKARRRYKGLVVDTAEKLFLRCLRFVCEKYNMEHPADQEYGKGWERLRLEFESMVNRINALPMGRVFISHSHESTIKTKVAERSRLSPRLTGTARAVIVPLVDAVFYIGYSTNDPNKRIIQLLGNETVEAGGRMFEAFTAPSKITYKQGMNLASVMSVFKPRTKPTSQEEE